MTPEEMDKHLRALCARSGVEFPDQYVVPTSTWGDICRVLMAVCEKLVERVDALEKK